MMMSWIINDQTDIEAIQYLRKIGLKNPAELISRLKSSPNGMYRLDMLIHGDRVKTSSDVKRNCYFSNLFKDFTERVPQWSESSQNVVKFWDILPDKILNRALVIREVRSAEPCCMNAVVVFEHYKKLVISGGNDTTMFSTGKVMTTILEDEGPGKLVEYLLNSDETGRSATNELRKLCNLDNKDMVSVAIPSRSGVFPDVVHNSISESIFVRMQSGEPALVSQIRAAHLQQSNDQVSFSGELPEGVPESPRHAMVLVGARKECGNYYFLLQNWWRSQHFIEVSSDYLSSCDAKITYIVCNTFERREKFDKDIVIDAVYAETCDVCETMSWEL